MGCDIAPIWYAEQPTYDDGQIAQPWDGAAKRNAAPSALPQQRFSAGQLCSSQVNVAAKAFDERAAPALHNQVQPARSERGCKRDAGKREPEARCGMPRRHT